MQVNFSRQTLKHPVAPILLVVFDLQIRDMLTQSIVRLLQSPLADKKM